MHKEKNNLMSEFCKKISHSKFLVKERHSNLIGQSRTLIK
jgi:hypothetical protein